MPKFPNFSQKVNALSGSVFEKFLPKMTAMGDHLIRLHIGDSYRRPPYELPIADRFVKDYPDFNRYCNTRGVLSLREQLVEKLRSDNALDINADEIMMTAGASNALNVSLMSLIDPGDEVLVLTPAWPFVFGMVTLAGGKVVELPFYIGLYDSPQADIITDLEAHVSQKTVAIYLNSPNNPSGKVLTKAQLKAVADFAKRHDLWVLSDEAYDGMTYDNLPHYSIASFPEMQKRTLSIFTFSKVFMFAGIRLGYVVAPFDSIKQLNKVLLHEMYSPSTLGQYMMVEPVKRRQEWFSDFTNECAQLRDMASELLKATHFKPEGAYYLFFDISSYLKGRDYWQVIEECLDAGASIAPGKDFGHAFTNYIRVCFAGEAPERIEAGIKRLNQVLGF